MGLPPINSPSPINSSDFYFHIQLRQQESLKYAKVPPHLVDRQRVCGGSVGSWRSASISVRARLTRLDFGCCSVFLSFSMVRRIRQGISSLSGSFFRNRLSLCSS